MNRFEAIKKEHVENHKKQLDLLAGDIRREAQRCGVDVYLFGSYAEGRIDEYSDLDIALSKNQKPENIPKLRRYIDRRAGQIGVNVDVVIKEDVDIPEINFVKLPSSDCQIEY